MQTTYFERPEGTLAYSDYGGNGELVLMLPGMGDLRSEYRYLLADRAWLTIYRQKMPDRNVPNYRQSMADTSVG